MCKQRLATLMTLSIILYQPKSSPVQRTFPVADLLCKILTLPLHNPIDTIFFIFIESSGKFDRIIHWRPRLGLAPSSGKSLVRP